ncbi:MAG: hypothetical protein ACE5NP_04970 [Anaerolineae bacterium]
MDKEEYLTKLERNLMAGSARWVTGFNESFRDEVVGGIRFDMLVTGKTRVKGFFLSNIMSYFILPNWLVACFVFSGDLGQHSVHSLLRVVSKYMDDKELNWCWLVIVKEGSFSSKVKKLVANHRQRDIGLALVDVSSQEIIGSSSYLGKKLPQHLKCFR